MGFIIFDFLDDCKNELMLEQCKALERLYHISNKDQHGARTRLFLEAFFRMVCNEERSELPRGECITDIELSSLITSAYDMHYIKHENKDMSSREYTCILNLKGYNNASNHLLPLSQNDKNSYDYYTKQTAMADLYAVTKCIYTRYTEGTDADVTFVRPSLTPTSNGEFYEKLNKLPFYSPTGAVYEYEKTLNSHYQHYLCHERIEIDNRLSEKETIIRMIDDPNDPRERDIMHAIDRTPYLKQHIKLSENILYAQNDFKISALTLEHNQCTLREYIRERRIDITEALNITYSLTQVLKSLFNLENHKICHRNINPDTIIIEKDENGAFSKLWLSCFDHAKVHNATLTVNLERQAQHPFRTSHSISHAFVYPKLSTFCDQNGSISIDRSCYLDAYSTAAVLTFLSTYNTPDDATLNIEGFNTLNGFSDDFKKYIIDFLNQRINVTQKNDNAISTAAMELYNTIETEHKRISPTESAHTAPASTPAKAKSRNQQVNELNAKINDQQEAIEKAQREHENDQATIKSQEETIAQQTERQKKDRRAFAVLGGVSIAVVVILLLIIIMLL